jgi:DNA polymerase
VADQTETDFQRGLVQHLESWRRAGVTHLPRGGYQEGEASPAVEQRTHPAAPLAATAPPGEGEPAVRPAPAAPRTEPSAIPAAERRAKLAAVAQRVAACRRCDELCGTRTQTVFGVGDPQARVMFIGEAPGADEDARGEPFVGKAGQLLNKIIAACGWRREDVYICNILKCRPPGNRNPTQDEADHCREFLDGQIEIVDPDYIVCWGSVAATNLLGVKNPIGRMRGRTFAHGRARVVCTYHPSYLLRNPAAKKDVWNDMQFLLREMGVEPPAR